MKLKSTKKQIEREIGLAQDLKSLENIFEKYLGKKGQLTQVLRSLKELPEKERKKVGQRVNQLKKFLKVKLEKKQEEIKREVNQSSQWFDITIPAKKISLGHFHPLTQVKKRVEEIFQSMGFTLVEGPEIESQWYNFDALNIPAEHPARDLWDTFYIKNGLLRTHTTPVDVRYLEKNNPPLRIITIGRCFRHEATDASHEVNFYQLDGLMVGKDISAANFKAVIEEFFKRFFNREIKIRMRPSYFPFTEPSFEVDITCLLCGGKGCSVCSQSGWMEMMGAGMVHPAVFKNSRLNPKDWQGFAFGLGLDRLAMMKYKINDIRLFYSGDLRFLQQF